MGNEILGPAGFEDILYEGAGALHYRCAIVMARDKHLVKLFPVNSVDKFCYVNLPQLVDSMGVLPKGATEACGL